MSDETMVNFGGSIKSQDDGRISGYLVLFSDEKSPDLAGDFFTKDTDFGDVDGMKTFVWFNHRRPLKTRDKKTVAVREKIGEGSLKVDDKGVLIDAVLYNRAQYEEALEAMGWSSGTASHLVEREKKGGAFHIKQWLLGLDASITPRPCEPRTAVVSLKSVSDDYLSDFIVEDNAIKAIEKSLSVKGLFEQMLAERTPSFWELHNVLCDGAKKVAMAAAASDLMDNAVDVDTQVNTLVDEYAARVKPLIITQVNEYVSSPQRPEYFYLKSALDELITDGSRAGLRFSERLDMVLAAVERVTNDAKEIHEMRKAQKAGRKISASRMTKLKELMTSLQDLIADAEGVPETEDDGKSAEILSLAAEFEYQKLMHQRSIT